MIQINKKSFTCFYCNLFHEKVEAEGIFYCPNALCTGPGGESFRSTLDSYKDIDDKSHCVDEDEWLKKGKQYNKKNNIPIREFSKKIKKTCD
jgi:hypothetical protein